MPRRSQRTKGRRRVAVRTPGGRVVIRFEKRRPSAPRCAWCGSQLAGIPSGDLNKYSKTEKTVERPYGGNLCHRCLEGAIRREVLKEWL